MWKLTGLFSAILINCVNSPCHSARMSQVMIYADIVKESTALNPVKPGQWLHWTLAVITKCGQGIPPNSFRTQCDSVMPHDVKVFINIGSGDHLPPNPHQATTRANTNTQFYLRWKEFCEIWIKFPFSKMFMKTSSSAKRRLCREILVICTPGPYGRW